MDFAKRVALVLMEDHDGKWPSLKGGPIPTSVCQDSTYTLKFDEDINEDRWGKDEMEVDGFPFIEEYSESGETATREEVELIIQQNPHLISDVAALRKAALAEMKVLNDQIAVLIDQVSVIAGAAGVDCEINLGKRGRIDLDGDWDASRC